MDAKTKSRRDVAVEALTDFLLIIESSDADTQLVILDAMQEYVIDRRAALSQEPQ